MFNKIVENTVVSRESMKEILGSEIDGVKDVIYEENNANEIYDLKMIIKTDKTSIVIYLKMNEDCKTFTMLNDFKEDRFKFLENSFFSLVLCTYIEEARKLREVA